MLGYCHPGAGQWTRENPNWREKALADMPESPECGTPLVEDGDCPVCRPPYEPDEYDYSDWPDEYWDWYEEEGDA
jgi:hypothetical protein